MAGDAELRCELEAAASITDPGTYLKRLDECRKKFKHTVFVLPDGVYRRRSFNCFAYAFGIWEHPDYVALVEDTGKSAIMNSSFIKAELARGYLQEVNLNAASVGDIVIYFRDDKPTHAGKIAATEKFLAVHSKW